MKRLVKTAKQQFDEVLNSLKVLTTYEYTDTDILYGCEGEKGFLFILREINGEEFYRYSYGEQWDSLFFSERFLRAMTSRFMDIGTALKPLFDWYLSADHADEPFTLDDIWMCDLEYETTTFEDIYEEVPDKTIITAEQQWDEESKDLYQFYLGDGAFRIKKDDGVFTLYIAIDEIFEKRLYPSFDELRKDASFVVKYIDYVQKSHPDDMEYALEWLNGGEYTMSEVSLLDIYDIIEPLKSIIFEDKEECPIEEMLKLTEEQNEAVGMIEEGVRRLRESGGVIFQYYDYNEYFVANGNNLSFGSANDPSSINKLLSDGYLDVSVIMNKQKLDFYNNDWALDGSVFAKKSN